jgi:uncharacterized protein
MGLVRLLSILFLLWLGWFFLRNYLARQNRASKNASRKPLGSTRVVKCDYCEVHLPENTALHEDDLWFCNQAHRQAWLEQR